MKKTPGRYRERWGTVSRSPTLHGFRRLNWSKKGHQGFHVTCWGRSQWRSSRIHLYHGRSQHMGNIRLKTLTHAHKSHLSCRRAADNLMAYLPRSCSTDMGSAKRFPGRWFPRPWRRWTPSYSPIFPLVESLPREPLYLELGHRHLGYLRPLSWFVNLLQKHINAENVSQTSANAEERLITWTRIPPNSCLQRLQQAACICLTSNKLV